MKRDQFDHLIRAAAAITGDDWLVVIGSQAILGSWPEDELPAAVVASQEADLIPAGDDQKKRDLIDGSIGEFSQFHEVFGVWAHGVADSTAILPSGWRERLVRYESAATGGAFALCLEPHDLWVAKAMRADTRDISYCRALASSGRLSLSLLRRRISATPAAEVALARALALAEKAFSETRGAENPGGGS